MNLGGGESAMVSFLHHWALGHFIDLAGYLGRSADAEQYAGMQKKVRNTCNDKLWDREWFIRGITKDGRKIGTFQDQEGRIHLESNAWAVLSQAAEEEKGAGTDGIVIFHGSAAPAQYTFRRPGPGIGMGENRTVLLNSRIHPGDKPDLVVRHRIGGRVQHNSVGRKQMPVHAVHGLAALLLLCRLGQYRPGVGFQMNPAFLLGRARHPFMTGSGGWAYYAATRYMLGVRPGFKELVIDPCIPASWKEFSLVRRWRGAEYRICVKNPESIEKGVRELRLDGKVTDHIPVLEPGTVHTVEVTMGKQ